MREIWSDAADLTPYDALTPAQPLDQVNPPRTRAAPYPGARRMSALEAVRGR